MRADTDLERFVEAQRGAYADVLDELRAGRKTTHWMWFVFPQLRGLGHSPTAHYYGIDSAAEARAYLAHPVLGPRLRECIELLLRVEGRSAHAIFGSPDDLKLRSSLTLFQAVSNDPLFGRALERYYDGRPDGVTLERLGLGQEGSCS